ncbi:MAG: TonB-dependent receptor [Bacteroidaceae bacterium]|nr:TonB-dependent receptor [Bacteroidaceae bacterium]
MRQEQRFFKKKAVKWHRFENRGYCAFASLKRVVCIGILSASTLSIAAKAQETQGGSATQQPVHEGDEQEEQRLDELTVSGSMAPLSLLQSARIVGVLSREDIQQSGAQSVNDLFKLAPGVDVRQRGGFGIQTDISIDGGTFDQITILLNGVNITNPHTGHLSADFPVSISDIERIEILEGAASRVYGSTAFGGALNIVTRRDPSASATVGMRGGSFGTFDAEARGSLKLLDSHHRLSGGGGRSDGGTANSDWRRGQLYYQGDLDRKDFSLDWQFGFSRKAYGANTFYSATYPDQFERNERYIASVSGETKGVFRFTPKAYWQRSYDNFELVRGKRFGENFHRTDIHGIQLGGHIAWLGGRTAVATEMRHEGILSTSLGHDLDAGARVSVHNNKGIDYTREDNRTNVSFSLEHNILLPHWTLSAGLLANMNTCIDHRFRLYPGADLAWRPDTRWKVSLSYNKGLRLPTFTDLYYKSPTHNGNTDLRAEENHSLQLAARYSGRGFSTTVRGFHHRGRRLIDWVMYSADDTYHSANFNLDNSGLQGEVTLDLPQLLGKNVFVEGIRVGYTYMHQKRHDHTPIYRSNYAMEYLRHKLVASLHHRIVSHLSATWNLRWQDRMGQYIRFGTTYTDPATGFLRAQTDGRLVDYTPYATLDVKLQWTGSRYRIFVEGTNVTARRYYDLSGVRQPGAWVMAGAAWDF